VLPFAVEIPDADAVELPAALLVGSDGGGADDVASEDGGRGVASVDPGALGAAEDGGGGACSLEARGLATTVGDGPGPG
jgi:hypothetical protein